MKDWEIKVFLGFFAILLFAYFLTQYTFLVQHEKVHQLIYSYYDVPSQIKIYSLSAGATIPDVNALQKIDANTMKQIEFLHSLNEIFGYQISFIVEVVLIFAAFTIAFIFIVWIDLRERVGKK